MDLVEHCCDQIAQEPRRDHLAHPLLQLDTGGLGCVVDGHEQTDLTLTCVDFREVNMSVPNRVSLELFLRLVFFNLRQA